MDLTIFIVTTLVAVLSIVGMYVYGNLRRIQNSWSQYRCNPLYMPFAGIIDPTTGTAGNFQHCMNLIGKSIFGQLSDWIHAHLGVAGDAISEISGPLSIFRVILSSIRKLVISFTSSTLGKATGPVSMFVYYLNKIQDILRRMVGEGYIAAFFGATAVSFIESFVTLCISVIKGFVYAMLAISIVLALFQPELLAIVLVIASMLAAAGA
jgi:hypothetical protein